MRLKASHTFAISLQEMAFMQGFGRASIVFISLAQLLNLFFAICVYLYIIRAILGGLNCQFGIFPTLIGANVWIIFGFLLATAFVLATITLFVFTPFKRQKLWSVLVWVSFAIIGLTTLGLFIFAEITNFQLGHISTCGSLMEIRNFTPALN